ncbi:MAG: hypothetical protein JRE23_10110 [Deltaproteobacteria bacterium]|nr:hypothetical protein [Deltaproteobacteria bacterium]
MGWTYMNKDKGVGIKDFFSKEFNSDKKLSGLLIVLLPSVNHIWQWK